MNTIPTKINRYNVYNAGNRLLGVGDELTLPDFEPSSETVTGAGILGEIDDPTVGYFGNQEIEIPFRVLDKEAVDMMDMTKAIQLEIRGAQQTTDSEGNIEFCPMRVVVRGRSGKFSAGKVKAGSPMDTKATLTVLYILIELDGKTVLELDKLNEVYKVNGVDVLAKIKEMC
ncbi:MAG: phage major tail tube protein [Candidatus Heteroscillospira sp.]|jgi:P2 family phage contractile tail tube protein